MKLTNQCKNVRKKYIQVKSHKLVKDSLKTVYLNCISLGCKKSQTSVNKTHKCKFR